jgi:hypothetical protein
LTRMSPSGFFQYSPQDTSVFDACFILLFRIGIDNSPKEGNPRKMCHLDARFYAGMKIRKQRKA